MISSAVTFAAPPVFAMTCSVIAYIEFSSSARFTAFLIPLSTFAAANAPTSAGPILPSGPCSRLVDEPSLLTLCSILPVADPALLADDLILPVAEVTERASRLYLSAFSSRITWRRSGRDIVARCLSSWCSEHSQLQPVLIGGWRVFGLCVPGAHESCSQLAPSAAFHVGEPGGWVVIPLPFACAAVRAWPFLRLPHQGDLPIFGKPVRLAGLGHSP